MRVVIYDWLHSSHKVYEGDPTSVERQIVEDMPWHGEHFEEGDLESLLAYIDAQQMFSVDVEDDSAHPFLKE